MQTTPMTTAPMSTAPSPTGATDAAAFVAELRRLKAWSGRSFRQLERQAAAAGDSLPASTVATMLGRNRLPREELLLAFLRACGLDGDARQPWLEVRATIAGGAAPTVPTPQRPTRWRTVVAAVAALVIAFAGGAAFTAGIGATTTSEQEVTVAVP
ncbi:helix-turn-helix domain-containing protein [Pseudonocardia sp. TRM90224]|uniref:helix-turn-helix domain-containing protein n=1 Tax=Pseudonocardia sp. TRM90224 TaxID=2812678 RepID=UPI001E501F2B|nr:helix-turn-helix transcriptional regulator [Pseudonocardia sp. TRM90224]